MTRDRRPLYVLALQMCAAVPLWLPSVTVAQEISSPDFAEQIRPLLSDRCYACHGPDEKHREGDLRLDELDGVTKQREGGRIVVPGDAKASLLIKRITSNDPAEVMPPPESGKSLTEKEKLILRAWVDDGATWRKHWAYELPREVPTPSVDISADIHEPANWIDSFIAQKFSAVSGQWSPQADDITLLRRVTFDLTGLPPAVETVSAADLSKFGQYERYVEQLLASPAFGERLAVYWLDLVRYADSVGYHGDQEHHSTPYRDYVINALNDNLPFDQFTREQLAGDLLPNPTEEQIAATCYNRLLQTSHEGGVQPKEYLAMYAADRVRNVSGVWMGATVGCAQCHDHKFDPYSDRNFYELAAFFADVDESTHLTKGADASPTQRFPEKDFLGRVERQQLAKIRTEIQSLEEEQSRLAEAVTDSTKRTAEQLASLITAAKEQEQAIANQTRRAMVTVSIEPRVMRILPRGNWLDDSGDVVSPALPSFLGKIDRGAGSPSRLDLANWFCDARHGAGLLTARVFVNRFWYLMFGEGLSTSLEDFGGQGDAPSHPELLDQLAIEFVRSGWDIKHMFRLLATTRTYRQSSLESPWHRQHDPENKLFSRQARFRLPAEFVRDAALTYGNLMVRQVGGGSARPYQPGGYYKHLNFPPREYVHDKSSNQWRRGVYTHWQRMYLHPMLRAFDAPSREECTSKRTRSNTPLSALVLMNDPSFIEAARGLATNRLLDSTADDRLRLNYMFQLVTSRTPDPLEYDVLRQLLDDSRQEFRGLASEARKLNAIGMMQTGELKLDAVELAAWTMVARGILNLGEAYTRN